MSKEKKVIKEPKLTIKELSSRVIALEERVSNIEANELRHLNLKIEEILSNFMEMNELLYPKITQRERIPQFIGAIVAGLMTAVSALLTGFSFLAGAIHLGFLFLIPTIIGAISTCWIILLSYK